MADDLSSQRDPPTLSEAQRAAAVAYLEGQAAAAEDAVSQLFKNDPELQGQQLGAIRIVKNTSLKSMRSLATRDSGDGDRRFLEVAHTAQDSLDAIQGYARQGSVDAEIGRAAQRVADVASAIGDAASFGLSQVWDAIPLSVKIVGGLAIAGVAFFYLRPVLGLIPARAAP